ncbi:MAG: hypothetical protein JSR58_00245 [Verrucomicrobia bacterium]|nr:hypothetical protein [Verrucomicrobiota bacterium]
MGIKDSHLNYYSEESLYTSYIAQLERLDTLASDSSVKCRQLFNSFLSDLEQVSGGGVCGTPHSLDNAEQVISFLKENLRQKEARFLQQTGPYQNFISQWSENPDIQGLEKFLLKTKLVCPLVDYIIKTWLPQAKEIKDFKAVSKLLYELFALGKKEGYDFAFLEKAARQKFEMLTNPKQINEHLQWLGQFFAFCYFDPTFITFFQDNLKARNVIEDIFCLTDHRLQEHLTQVFFCVCSDSQKRKTFLNINPVSAHLNTVALCLAGLGIELSTANEVLLSLKSYKDRKIVQTINLMLTELNLTQPQKDSNEETKETLSLIDKRNIVSILFIPPHKNDRESDSVYQRRLADFREKQRKGVFATRYLLLSNNSGRLKNVKTIDELLQITNSLASEGTGLSESHIESFIETFMLSKRYPGGIAIYMAELKKNENEDAIKMAQKFVAAVLEGKFSEERYAFEGNLHLKDLFENRSDLYGKWKTSLASFNLSSVLTEEEAKTMARKGWTLHDTDNWEDLLLIGTETSTCQRLAMGDEGLLAYILNGKIRVIAIKDREGKIVARAILRVLKDSETNLPVLYIDRLYSNETDSPRLVAKLIESGGIAKAREMGLCLVSNATRRGRDGDLRSTNPYKTSLISLSGPPILEYLDFNDKWCPGGKFKLDPRHPAAPDLDRLHIEYDPKA